MHDLILVAVSFFVWGIGEGLFFYFQPIYLQELGATPVVIGIILGLNGLAMTLVQTPGGILADKIGNHKVMIASWVIATLATLIMAFAPSLLVFSIGWIGYGLSSSSAATNGYITKMRGKLGVGRALTVVSAAYHLGAFIGPTIGGSIGENLGLRMIYRFSLLFFLVSTIVIFFSRPDPIEHHDQYQPRHNLLRNRSFVILLVICFFSIFSGYLAEPLTPNFLQDIHRLTLAQIGQLGSIGSLGNAIISLLFGGVKPFLGIMLGHLFLGGFSLMMWRGTGMAWFAIGFFLRGGYRIYQAMYLAVARTLAPPKDLGLAYGIIATGNSIAIILAPLVAGIVYEVKPVLIYPVSISLVGLTLLMNFFTSRFLGKSH